VIRLYTGQAIDGLLKRHRKAITAQLAGDIAAGIETLLPLPCDHRDRPSCARCSQRRTVQAAAAVARETGGAQQRERGRDA